MSAREASVKANMSFNIGYFFYKMYLQDQITQLLHYIADDKVAINAASINVNIRQVTAGKYDHT
ncbi:hypothetical protein K501DRAFT_287115 [Backusella circina FSU 941]|nr:hypothetical protein K501DRAFT_287115 [Backusella circina FSU 941]